MGAVTLLAETVVDARVSVYSLAGDVFAQAAAVAAGAMALVLLLKRSGRH